MRNDNEIVINILGVGGGGGNSIINTYDKINDLGLTLNFFVANTDLQALSFVGKRRITKIVVGMERFQGIGAGTDPISAYDAVRKEGPSVLEPLFENDPNILFISVGLGGGTGSGVTPFIAEEAKKRGVLTIVFGTFPWGFEGPKREENALLSLKSLRNYADSIIIVNNDFLTDSKGVNKSLITDLFKKTDEWLRYSILTIASLILEKSMINIDFNDIKAALNNSGFGFFFIMDVNLNEAFGKNQSNPPSTNDEAELVYKTLKKTYILNLDVAKATYMVVNVSGNEDTLSIDVMNTVFNKIKKASPNINILFGLSFNPFMEPGEMQLSGLFAGVKYDIKNYDDKNSSITLQKIFQTNEQAMKKGKDKTMGSSKSAIEEMILLQQLQKAKLQSHDKEKRKKNKKKKH